MRKRIFPLLISALLLSGCATTIGTAKDAEKQGAKKEVPKELQAQFRPGPHGYSISQISSYLAGDDPIEGFNRSMFAVTDFTLTYVADPLGRFYTTLFPRPFIEALDRACKNLEFPALAISSMLNGEWRMAGDDSLRFLINTTIGLAGFFDPAESYFHIYPSDSDFGQAFANWGMAPGCTLMLPFDARSNVRDQFGFLFDVAFDAKTYIPYAGWATALNRMVIAHRDFTELTDGNADSYRIVRDLLILRRELEKKRWAYRKKNQLLKIKKGELPPPPDPKFLPPLEKPEGLQGNWVALDGYLSISPEQDALRSIYFKPVRDNDFWFMKLSLFNRDFSEEGKMRSVEVVPGRPELKFGYWAGKTLKKDGKECPPENLVFVIPGIGGNCRTTGAMALAEIFNDRGYAAVTLENPLCWRFMDASPEGRLAGFTPQDSEMLEKYLNNILRYLKEKQSFEPKRITVTGYSLGGLITLHLASRQNKRELIKVDRYLAINPPVDMLYALRKADEIYSRNAKLPIDQLVSEISEAAGLYMLTERRTFPGLYEKGKNSMRDFIPPLSQCQAELLIGLSFRLPLRNMILAAHRNHPLPGLNEPYSWFTREGLYRKLDEITYVSYAQNFLLTQQKREADFKEFAKLAGLYSIERALRDDPKIRIMHNYDDFLLQKEDRDFLDRTLGAKLTWFNAGSHLGNLYIKEVQQKLFELGDASVPQKGASR